MKTKILNFTSVIFICLSAFSILSVSIMAFIDPQQVMDLVQVKLANTDAYSSIRGVYGGVGITIVAALIFLSKKNLSQGVMFLCLLWGMYAVSRLITIFIEGELGAFGSQWLKIETTFMFIAVVLLLLRSSKTKAG